MTLRFLITLDQSVPHNTINTATLRQKFEEAWASAASSVLAVPGITLIRAGRFAHTMEAFDTAARDVVDRILTAPLMTQNPPPTPKPF